MNVIQLSALRRRHIGKRAYSDNPWADPAPGRAETFVRPIPNDERGIRFEIGKMVQYAEHFMADPLVIKTARTITQLCPAKDKTCEMAALYTWTKSNMRYINDPDDIEVISTAPAQIADIHTPPEVIEEILGPELIAQMMHYQKGAHAGLHGVRTQIHATKCFQVSAIGPDGVLPRTSGDCIPVSQKVVVRGGDHRYQVVRAGDLAETFQDREVVSYNEKTGVFEFDRITRFVDKGALPVFRIRLSNGTEFRCTENHELYVLERKHERVGWTLVTMTLRQLIDARAAASVNHRFAIPVAKQIPEADDPTAEALSEDQLWVEGLYVAEGWREAQGKGRFRVRIGMNNPEAIAELEDRLRAIGQPFGSGKPRKDGLVTVGLHVSPFSARLGLEFGALSADRQVPSSYLSLAKPQMSALLEAFAIGDGYRPTSGQWARWAHLIYNTQSEIFARQVAFMHLVLGRPVSFYRQPAWKTKPAMYRLYEYKGNAEEKAKGVVATRIVSIEPDEPERCCDLTVEKNHNFVLDGGALVHNCDEGASFLATLLLASAIPARYRFGGSESGGKPNWHHVWVQGQNENGDWIDMDVTEPEKKLGWFFPAFKAFGHYPERMPS